MCIVVLCIFADTCDLQGIILGAAAGLVQDAINKCDVDLRRELYNGIILAGEHTLHRCRVQFPLTGNKGLQRSRHLPGSRHLDSAAMCSAPGRMCCLALCNFAPTTEAS